MIDSDHRWDHYRSIFQNSDRATKIGEADVQRRDTLHEAIRDYSKLVAMTAKPAKFQEVLRLCQKLAGDSVKGDAQAPHLPELESSNPGDVAASKAVQIFDREGHVDTENPAVKELAARLRNFSNPINFIGAKGLELIRQALPTGTVVMGADTVYGHFDPKTGKWVIGHQFARLKRSFTEAEIFKIREELKQQYCFPESGSIEDGWRVGNFFMNGQVFTIGDGLRIKSKPIAPELYDSYMDAGLENGLFYNSNTHFGLLECLIENQGIQTIAALSDEEAARDLTFEDKAMVPVKSDYPVLEAGVIRNRALRLIQ